MSHSGADEIRPEPVLGERFTRALALAVELHGEQARKGSGIPYLGHILGVAGLVVDDGGSEDEAIAALLHDGPEDQGGQATLDRIREEFGPVVAGIVESCSDTLEDPKPPWRERKQRYLDHLEEATLPDMRVSCADKVNNARAILADLRDHGEALWPRFKGGHDGTLWYYRSLVEIFCRRNPGRLADELRRTVDEIEEFG